jgi:hypothetical protein
MFFIIYFSIQEIRQFLNQGKTYLFKFWTLVEWSIIGFSWAAFALCFYRINASYEVGKFFKGTSGFGYFKLQEIAFWNLTLNYSLSFCMVLGTLKFLKIFSFNKEISYLASTLSNCRSELLSFGFIFLIVWIGFVQLFYLFFQHIIFEFSPIMRAMTTCFQIMLGKFQVQTLLEANPVFGSIFYFLYNSFTIFILLTVFISIINDSFKVIREKTRSQKYETLDYNRDFLFGRKNENMGINDETIMENQNVYKDQIEYFSDKIDELLIIHK